MIWVVVATLLVIFLLVWAYMTGRAAEERNTKKFVDLTRELRDILTLNSTDEKDAVRVLAKTDLYLAEFEEKRITKKKEV